MQDEAIAEFQAIQTMAQDSKEVRAFHNAQKVIITTIKYSVFFFIELKKHTVIKIRLNPLLIRFVQGVLNL